MIAKTCPRIVDNELETGGIPVHGTGGIPTVCLCDKTENYPIRLLDMLRSVMYVDGYIYIYIHTVMQIDTDAISDHCMRIEGRIHIGQFC